MLRILPQVFLTLVTNFHHVFQVVSLKGLLGHLKENYVLISFRKHPLCAYKVGIPKIFFLLSGEETNYSSEISAIANILP